MNTTSSLSRALSGGLFVLLLCALCACGNNGKTEGEKPAENKPASGKTEAKPSGDKGKEGENAKAEKKEDASLTVYCGRKEKLVKPVLEGFEKETGVKVRVKYGKTQDMASALLKEGDRSPADVFFAQDASTLGFLGSKGIFEPLKKDTLGMVDENSRDPKGNWIGTSGRARVLVYNTKAVKPEELPKSVDDLLAPRWKGKIGWAPENASFKSAIAAMIQLEGQDNTEKWLKTMKETQAPKAYPKNTPAVRATAKGEIDVALVNHYYLFRVKDELGQDSPIKNHYFRNEKAEAMVNMAGVGIVKSSKKKDLAIKLVHYLLNSTAQAHFAEKVREFPVTQAVKPSEELPALQDLKAPKLDMADINNLEATEKALKNSGVLP